MVDFTLPRADQFAVLETYYRRLASEAGGVPCRTSFNPAEIKDLLPFIFIMECRAEDDLYVRLAGTEIERALRMSPTGKNYLDMVEPAERDLFQEVCAEIIRVPCGGFFRRVLVLENGSRHELHSKCLPFADRDGNVRYIIGMSSIRADMPLTRYDPPILNVSRVTGFHYEDLGYGIPDTLPTLPNAK